MALFGGKISGSRFSKSKLSSSGLSDSTIDKENISDEDIKHPNPFRYKLLKHEMVNSYLIIKIFYEDVTNYEGVKILVFPRYISLSNVIKQNGIDPHFLKDSKYIHPIARFEPTDNGWNMAVACCKNYT